MYVPHFNAVEDPADVESFVRAVGSAEFVTVDDDGSPIATLLPIIWDPADHRVIAHMARANDHWRRIRDGARALFIVAGAQTYVSPSWYASKREHGRVVPTWNYSSVHLSGTVQVHDDPSWVRAMVTQLTQVHEEGRPEPWAVSDAPEKYVTGQLRAIVGVQMQVDRVEAKAKLSQNRSDADREGVVDGLRSVGDARADAVADAMEDAAARGGDGRPHDAGIR